MLSTLTAPCSTPKEKSRTAQRKPSLRHLTAALKSSSVPAGQSRALAPYMNELGIKGEDQYAVTLNGAISRKASGEIMTSDLIAN